MGNCLKLTECTYMIMIFVMCLTQQTSGAVDGNFR